jgi:hypothetical protein
MISKSTDDPIIGLSTAVYELLLFAYPTRFRHEYGPQMTQLFRDCSLRSFRHNGAIGIIELWVVTLFDLARSLVEEHTQKEIGMTNSNFTRLSGWALMLTAAIFLLFFVFAYLDETSGLPSGPQSLYSITYFAVILASPVLLAVGLLGLRSRYGDSVGGFGKQILPICLAIGLAVSLIGIIGALVFSWDWAWFAQFAGPGLSFAGLALFGIPALSRKPLPRWNILPLVAGIAYPLLILYALLDIALTGNSPDSGGIAIYGTIIIQCLALFLLGWVVKGDTAKPAPTPLTAASAL